MKVILAAVLMGGLLTACTNKEQTKTEENMTTLNLVQEWDKVFPLRQGVPAERESEPPEGDV